jgi:hypothetical protein
MHLRYSSETPTFYQNLLAMRDTADVTGGKPIAVLLQSISGVGAINPLVAFYGIHGTKREELILLFCAGHHIRHDLYAPFNMGRFQLDRVCTKYVVYSESRLYLLMDSVSCLSSK